MNSEELSDDGDLFGPIEENRAGEIITFYSFKGGVGRTMALANAAFLAACNGKKVLVMDWDLEAPGLAYYFRGLNDPALGRSIKNSSGVLNFLWAWVSQVKGGTKEAIEQAAEDFNSGRPFQACVRQLVDPEFFESSEGRIDFIGAGSSKVEAPESTEYEEALARFPWHEFFTQLAGGFVPHALRTWASKHYDLILVDSRTGLAESAGLCTMQLPDSVAMCFVLNRQNIEGISKIAAAIRLHRPEVRLFAVPMRVSREGTSEESEARAKAITDLVRIGGFSADAVQQQLQTLGIKHADNVPFYEVLAQIVADDPEVDPVCLNYVRFSREVLGMPHLAPVQLAQHLVARARARLQPQMVTSEYLQKLLGSEPVRAINELQPLISSAEELVANGDRQSLGDDYLRLLTAAAFAPRTVQFMDRSYEIQRQALNILRMLRETEDSWSGPFIDALEAHLSSNTAMLDQEAEISIREELDAQLTLLPGSPQALKRIANRRRIAWLYFHDDDDVSGATASEIATKLELLRQTGELTPEELAEIQFVEADMLYLRGRIALRRNQFHEAKDLWLKATFAAADVVWDGARTDFKRVVSEVHAQLTVSGELLGLSRDEIKAHAIEAAIINGSGLSTSSAFFNVLSTLNDGYDPETLLRFLGLTVGSTSAQLRGAPMAAVWGRGAASGARLLEAFTTIVPVLASMRVQDVTPVLLKMAAVAEAVVLQISRRRSTYSGRRSAEIPRRFLELIEALSDAGVRVVPTAEAAEALDTLMKESNRNSSPTP